MQKFTLWLIISLATIPTLFAQHTIPYPPEGRVGVNPLMAPFFHGVASGDPLETQVIIWTRVTPDSSTTGIVEVDWEIATDTLFTQIVNSGTFQTDQSRDYTVKVDVTDLDPNTYYYYRFNALDSYSIIGRTKTVPSTQIDTLRFAIVSCSNLPVGYFHAYHAIGKRNDIDAVIHLGDYIYENGSTGFIPERSAKPPHEILNLTDYRMRHAQYKLDPALQYAHQQYPWMTVWDDHETANNAWKDGAQNHDPGSEGLWDDRKAAGVQAYYEWMPIRRPDPSNDQRIYRNIRYGDLAEIMLLDTRLEGRDEQDINAADDTTRTLLGADQRDWLLDKLSNSSSQWKVLAQQVMVAQLLAFGTPVNADQWDGYKAERDRVMNHILEDTVEGVVVVTGDIHTSWANDIPLDPATYDAATGDGSVMVEFVATSVTSTSSPIPIAPTLIQNFNPHIKYIDLTQKGYVVLDLNAERAQGDWYYVTDVTNPQYTEEFAAGYLTLEGTNTLVQATEASVSPSIVHQPQAPLAPVYITSIEEEIPQTIILNSHPNPFTHSFVLEYFTYKTSKNQLVITDVKGQTMKSMNLGLQTAGLQIVPVSCADLTPGYYFVTIKTDDQIQTRKMVKIQ